MKTRFVPLLAAIVAWAGLSLPIAQAFPGRGVSDAGNFFDDSHKQQALKRIDDLHKKFSKDVRVETFANVPDDHAEQLKKLGPDAFFKDWLKERAKSEHVDGVFVLICRKPGIIKVGVNEATRKTVFTETDREALWKLMKRRFDKQEFNAGLIDGLDYVQDRFAAQSTGQHKPAANKPTSQPAGKPLPPANANAPAQIQQGVGIMSIVVFAGIAFVVFLVVRGLFRAMTGGAGSGYGAGVPGVGGGGGFMSSFISGMLGAAVGNAVYDSFFRGHSDSHSGWDNSASAGEPNHSSDNTSGSQDDWSVNDGGSFGDSSPSDSGGGDFGGGDFGGGGSDF